MKKEFPWGAKKAGTIYERLHKLTRSDCTTRNKRRAAALSGAYDELEHRIEALRLQEEVDALRPELDGVEIGEVLGIPPGPDIGRAYRFLLELRLGDGPPEVALSHDNVSLLHTVARETASAS